MFIIPGNNRIEEAFEFFIQYRFYNEIKFILREYPKILNCIFLENGLTPLHAAIDDENIYLVKLFSKICTNINHIHNDFGETPLNYAIRRYDGGIELQKQIIIILLKNGANIITEQIENKSKSVAGNIINYGWNALKHSICHDKIDFLRILLRWINFNDLKKCKEFFQWSIFNCKTTVVLNEILNNNFIDAELKNRYGKTPIEIAIGFRKLIHIRFLLEYNIKFDYNNINIKLFFQYLLTIKRRNKTTMIEFCLYHIVKRQPNAIKNMLKMCEYFKFHMYLNELQKMKTRHIYYLNINKNLNTKKTIFQLLIMDLNLLAFNILTTNIYSKCSKLRKDLIEMSFPLFSKLFFLKLDRAYYRGQHLKIGYNKILVNCSSSKLLELPNNILQIIIALLTNGEINKYSNYQ